MSRVHDAPSATANGKLEAYGAPPLSVVPSEQLRLQLTSPGYEPPEQVIAEEIDGAAGGEGGNEGGEGVEGGNGGDAGGGGDGHAPFGHPVPAGAVPSQGRNPESPELSVQKCPGRPPQYVA